MASVSKLLEKAQRGIRILGDARTQVASKMEEIISKQGVTRIELLLHMLNLIAFSDECESLSSAGFVQTYNASNPDRIDQIFNYTFTHFKEPLSIKEIASAISLSPYSFSLHYKTNTLK